MHARALLLAFAAFVGLPALASAQPNALGTPVLQFVRFSQDPAKATESKTSAAHEAAITAGQNSTRIATLGTTRERIGNRQILQAMVDATLLPELKGWRLAYLSGSSLDGFYAIKTGQAAVAVPAWLLDWEGALIEARDARYSSRYEAARSRLTHAASSTVRGLSRPFSLSEVNMVGAARYDETETTVFARYGQPDQSITNRRRLKVVLTLFGIDMDRFVEGRLTLRVQAPADLSAHLPASGS